MTKKYFDDTIVAIATPIGVGAISVLRISGGDCFRIADKIFQGKQPLSNSKTHTIHYGKIINTGGDVVDDVLAFVFRGKNSYTGEDSIEISCHGNPLIAQKILEALLENGARIAESGEFTKRAFLNGRLDLAQAEAVAEVINARTEVSLRGARNQLDGLLSGRVTSLRDQITNASSLIELELDFAEEEIEFVELDSVRKMIMNIISEIENLLRTYRYGKVIRDGINVAIVGKPNVGKSSLLNLLLKDYRAIVSEIPGTTRDTIREEVAIDGVLFILTDTAGIRSSENVIEKEGIERSKKVISESDIVLFLNDVNKGLDADLLSEISELISKDNILTVYNKVDLANGINEVGDCVYISVKHSHGIETLFAKMKEKVFGAKIYSERGAVVTNIRHFTSLKNAKGYLESAIESIDKRMSGEFISVDLRNCAASLSEIIGEITADDVLNNIFQKFCIGK